MTNKELKYEIMKQLIEEFLASFDQDTESDKEMDTRSSPSTCLAGESQNPFVEEDEMIMATQGKEIIPRTMDLFDKFLDILQKQKTKAKPKASSEDKDT